MVKLIPIGEKFFVKKIVPSSEENSLIKIPEAYKKEDVVIEAEVTAVGDGVKVYQNGDVVTIPLKVKVGDIVLMHRAAGQPLEFENATFYSLRESDIYGIVKREK